MTILMDVAQAPVTRKETLAERLGGIARRLEALGLGAAAVEKRDLISIEREVSAETVEKLSLDDLLFLAEACGKALDLTFSVGRLQIFQLRLGTSLDDLEELKREARKHGSLKVKLLVYKETVEDQEGRERKEGLLDRLRLRAAHATSRLFLYKDALVRALEDPLPKLEDAGGLFEGATGDCKTVILVADRDLSLDGPYLAVAGGRVLTDWQSYCPTRAPAPGPIAEFRQRARDSRNGLSWMDGFSLQHLTPYQLQAAWREQPGAPTFSPGEPVIQALAAKLLELALVYTATQTRWAERRFVFQAEQSSGEVRPGVPQDLAEAASLVAAAELLARRAIWVYETAEGSSDRLRILRSLFADAFSDGTPEDNYRMLLKPRELTQLDRHVVGSWDSFFSGKLTQYFERVRQLEEVVDSSVQSFQGQVQALIKGLSDNMLGGVGVVVGSFLVSQFRGGVDPDVIIAGVRIYAIYLLIFPTLIGLSSAWQQLRSAEDAFNARVERFKKRLSDTVVNDLRAGAPSRAIKQFYVWFGIAAIVYLATVATLLAASWLLIPDLFAAGSTQP